MKKIFMAIAILFSVQSFAQITNVSLQASGLTCSMCSNSINKALKSIEYVDNVKANIKNSTFDITFKPDAKVDIDLLKKKVEDAGFFVAKLAATLQFNNTEIQNDSHILVDGQAFHFLNVKDQVLNGPQTIQVLDKGFVSNKQFKANKGLTKMTCYKTGVAESCCSKGKINAGSRVFHVTI